MEGVIFFCSFFVQDGHFPPVGSERNPSRTGGQSHDK
nr:MAG TPA: Photosystem II protein D1 [Caudoviricetes sp.]